jgi:RNA polymerase-binding transcription factor DksA
LLALRASLIGRKSEQLAKASDPVEPSSMSIADSATDQFDHDMALSSLSSGQDALFEVEEAMNRILNGTYGICEATNRPIPAARLRVIPWTRFTTDAEARLERQGSVRRPRLGELRSVQTPGSAEEAVEPDGEKEQTAPAPVVLAETDSAHGQGTESGTSPPEQARRRSPMAARRRKKTMK